jgi:hypothetical protein
MLHASEDDVLLGVLDMSAAVVAGNVFAGADGVIASRRMEMGGVGGVKAVSGCQPEHHALDQPVVCGNGRHDGR